MHIPWGWIKQRPHFLAEKLAEHFKIDVYCKLKLTNKESLSGNGQLSHLSNMTIHGYNIIPFDKIPILRHLKLDFINRIIMKIILPSTRGYDYIWIPSPYTYQFMYNVLNKKDKVIYDCMDDNPEFPDLSERRKNAMIYWEKKLVERADFIFFSSENLKRKVLQRAGINKKAMIVNNAIELPQREAVQMTVEIESKLSTIRKLSKPLMYIGTISEWFDFSLIKDVLQDVPDVNVVLIGPSTVEVPVSERIIVLGPIERKYIFEFMQEAYALIMPFELNELIESVNPVKLYEYIYSGKPVIARKYDETDKFKDYVYLYNDKKDFVSALDKIEAKPYPTANKEKVTEFVRNNTWTHRCSEILKFLEQ